MQADFLQELVLLRSLRYGCVCICVGPAAHPNTCRVQVHGGGHWQRSVAKAPAQGTEHGRVNAGSGGGQLTNLGWQQGEALGRRLRAIYGAPTLDALEVVSTDM